MKQPKAEKKQAAFLQPEELERLLETIEWHGEHVTNAAGQPSDVQWLHDLIRVAVATGLRRQELLSLRWQDVDTGHGLLRVANHGEHRTKSGHERTVPLAGDALEVLRRLEAERADDLDAPVFVDRRGLPIKKDRVSKRFKFFVREARLRDRDRLHFHSLRHTCGSWLAMKGMPMRVIQQVLGHSSISVTERYSHLAPEVVTKAMQETFG